METGEPLPGITTLDFPTREPSEPRRGGREDEHVAAVAARGFPRPGAGLGNE